MVSLLNCCSFPKFRTLRFFSCSAVAMALLLTLARQMEAQSALQTLRLLKAGDAAYAEKSFGRALKNYKAAEKRGDVPTARRDEIGVRITLALGRSKQWDRALTHGLDFVKQHRATVWEARGLHALAQIYLNATHEGYRVGSRLYRGSNVPKVKGNDSPQYTDVREQDTQQAREALEAARVLYDKNSMSWRSRYQTRKEEIQLDYDLARALLLRDDQLFYQWAGKKKWLPLNPAEWQVNAATPYDLTMPPPKKARWLFAHIRRLALSEKQAGNATANSLMGEALWLHRYHSMMTPYAQQWNGKKYVSVPYPYEKVKGTDILADLLQRYPNSAVREQAQFLQGRLFAQEGNLTQAVQTFRALIAARPRSKWVSDARLNLAQIQSPELRLETPDVAHKLPRLKLETRNIKQVRLAAYRVRLEDVVRQKAFSRSKEPDWSSTREWFGRAWKRRKSGGLVAQWSVVTKDSGNHRGQDTTTTVPLRENGAYIVEASASGITSTVLVLVSDLTLVQKAHRRGVLCYVTDSHTGQPVAGAQIVARQIWVGRGVQSRITRGTTNANGILDLVLSGKGQEAYFNLSTLAHKGNRYAMVSNNNASLDGEESELLKTYLVTDRSVYRPRQTVFYRQMVVRRQGGSVLPVVNAPVRMEVRDPNGKILHKRTATSNRFGSVSGKCALPENAALGEYSVTVFLPKEGQRDYAGNGRFRVEEYKKPEFEVTVQPDAERVRLGQPAGAKIQAKYYFGGAVPNAKVTYRIRQQEWIQEYHFPQKYDFLYDTEDKATRYLSSYHGEVVTQGTAQTDANGEARITFVTDGKENTPEGQPSSSYNRTFTIEADVQDASRRTITGMGEVKATKHDVAVFLNFGRGYATQGDQLGVEIRTLNPSDVPVSVMGTAKVTRLPDTPKGKETPVHQEALTTDAQGYAMLKWTATQAGHYRIVFATQDGAGQTVKSDLKVWVDGAELARGRFLFQSIYIGVKQPYVQAGEAAKVLLITPSPNCTVLLTREADDEILEQRIVRVPGRSLEVAVPMTRRDVPNVHLSAVLVRNGRMFEATQEIFVPPARQFARVTVTPDKSRYEPGEKATLRLHASDWQGRPLRTELSVSVYDAALGYIQQEYAGDIRTFFYGNRRSESVSNNGSFDSALSSEEVYPVDKRRFRVHRWELPDGMGSLDDWLPESYRRDAFRVQWSLPPPNVQGVGGRLMRVSDFESDSVMVAGSMAGEGRYNYSMAMKASGDTGVARNGFVSDAYKDIDRSGIDGAYGAMHGMPGKAKPRVLTWNPPAYQTMTLGGRAVLVEPTLRTRFADTAFWTPATVTDAAGNATVQVTWPDNLTQWKANAIGTTTTAQVGAGAAQVVTKKDLLVRLQAPRFLVEQDQVVLTANVLNSLPDDARVNVKLDMEGANAELAAEATGSNPRELWLDVPKQSEKRVDWTIRVKQDGALRVRMTAQSDKAADATETILPVLVHGVEKLTTQSGVLRGTQTAQVPIVLPAQRKPGTSELIVQVNPSLAAVMLDALPYLADYPYGCIEQTLSRFVPSVVLAKSLKDLGYNLDDLKKRAVRQMQQAKQSAVRPRVANSPYTYPNGQPGELQSPQLTPIEERALNPVFDRKLLNQMIEEGLSRIASSQNQDGGWGWWKDSPSDATMTGYVCYGLLLARQSGAKVNANVLARGLGFLRNVLEEEKGNLQEQAAAARILAMEKAYRPMVQKAAMDTLFPRRSKLTPYSQALLALALHDVGKEEPARVLLRNLESVVQVDRANGTAHWEETSRRCWHWYDNATETNAAILQAYLAIQPNSEMPALLVKWLVNNRRATIWNSTRETALTIYALAEYVRVKKELAPDSTITVRYGDDIRREIRITHDNALFFDNRIVVPDAQLTSDNLPLTISQTGKGVCYFNAYTRTFSQEDNLKATGNEIAVHRRYFRLLPQTAHSEPEIPALDPLRPNPFLSGDYAKLALPDLPTDSSDSGTDTLYQRVALQDGEELKSGEMIEAELELESGNDYEYLLFEDIKPAGCEPVDVRSGDVSGKGVYANRELRDQKVAFFLNSLPQGRRILSYRLRAELPGQFRSLPVNGYAVYAPDIRALSDEQRIGIRDEAAAVH